MHYELMAAARAEMQRNFKDKFPIAWENIDFIPPENGSMWLKFDYMEADTRYTSLDRKCMTFIGMVQVGVVFSAGEGTDSARKLAKSVAQTFFDGKILDTGFVSEGGIIHKVQKQNSGWLIPVRFYVRIDHHNKE